MNFNIYIINDTKLDTFYLEAIKEYEKRLSRYCKIKLQYLKKEEHLLSKLSKDSYTILISTKGRGLSSEEFAEKIDNYGLSGISNLSIVVGDSLKPSNYNFSESMVLIPMDIEIGLLATVLYEQIYRAYRIINNHPYHK